MPHVVVKLVPGRSKEQKARLAAKITKDIVSILTCDESLVSVGFEEVEPQDWMGAVYEPEIRSKWDTLYKQPGYTPY
jgi:4-oxalocrotonate tautomerase